jgi:hypothetical protein
MAHQFVNDPSGRRGRGAARGLLTGSDADLAQPWISASVSTATSITLSPRPEW